MTSFHTTEPSTAIGDAQTVQAQPSAAITPPSPGHPKLTIRTWIAPILVGGCGGVVLAGTTAQWLWVGELAVHWSGHATLGLLPVLVLWWRRPRFAIPLVLLAMVGVMPGLRSLLEPRCAAAAGSATPLTVAFANVYDFNRERPRALEAIAGLDAEVIGLAEVSVQDRPRFFATRWPFQHWEDRAEVLSVALLSTHPIVTTTLHDVVGAGVLEATIDVGQGRQLQVIVAHLFSPKGGTTERRRNKQLHILSGLVTANHGPLLLLGDLNLSPASPYWRTFINDTRLGRAEGLSPATWPAIFGFCGISIDHLLVRGLGLAGVQPFPVPGSDHRGLRATAWLAVGEGS